MGQINLQKTSNPTTPPVDLYGIFFDLAGFPWKIDDEGNQTPFVTGGVSLVPITHADLLSLINASQLVQGTFYMITDFATVYEQPDFDSGKLEKAPVTKTGTTEPIICYAVNESEIGKQCFSTVHKRDIIEYDPTYTQTENNSSPAKGKITRRIDEYENSVPYDSREVKFKRYLNTTTGTYINWYDESGANNYQEKLTFGNDCRANYIEVKQDPLYPSIYNLPNIVFGEGCSYNRLVENSYHSTFGSGCNNNKLESFLQNTILDFFSDNVNEGQFQNNFIGNSFKHNKITNSFRDNTIGSNCMSNKFDGQFFNNDIGTNFQNNNIHENFYNVTTSNVAWSTFSFNTFKSEFKTNNVDTITFKNNVFNSETYSNTFTGGFFDNICENEYHNNTNTGMVSDNLFKRIVEGNTFSGSNFINNQIEEPFENNTITASVFNENVIKTGFRNNTIGGNSFFNNKIDGEQFVGNTLTATFTDNIIEIEFQGNSIISYSTFCYNKIRGSEFLNNEFTGCVFTQNELVDTDYIDNTHTYMTMDHNKIVMSKFDINSFTSKFTKNYIKCNNFTQNTMAEIIDNHLECDVIALNVIGYTFTNNKILHSSVFSGNTISYVFQDNTIELCNYVNNTLSGTARNYFRGTFAQNTGSYIHDNKFVDIITNNTFASYGNFNKNDIDGTFSTNTFQYNITGNKIRGIFNNVSTQSNFEHNNFNGQTNYVTLGANFQYNTVVLGLNNVPLIGNNFQYNYIKYIMGGTTIQDNFQYNTIKGQLIGGTIGNNFANNTFEKDATANVFGHDFQGNHFKGTVDTNSFGQGCQFNTISGDFYSNSIGVDFQSNTIKGQFSDNDITAPFISNDIDANFYKNIIQGVFYANIIAEGFSYNKTFAEFSFNRLSYGFSGIAPIDGDPAVIQEFPNRKITDFVIEAGLGITKTTYDFSTGALGAGDEAIVGFIPANSYVTKMSIYPQGISGLAGAKLSAGLEIEDETGLLNEALLGSFGATVTDVMCPYNSGIRGMRLAATANSINDGKALIVFEFTNLNK